MLSFSVIRLSYLGCMINTSREADKKLDWYEELGFSSATALRLELLNHQIILHLPHLFQK